MPSKSYITFCAEIRDMIRINYVFHCRKPRYVVLCTCGDLDITSNKSFAEDHKNIHQYANREYTPKGKVPSRNHIVQIFREDQSI